jgi:hypothetical protein
MGERKIKRQKDGRTNERTFCPPPAETQPFSPKYFWGKFCRKFSVLGGPHPKKKLCLIDLLWKDRAFAIRANVQWLG